MTEEERKMLAFIAGCLWKISIGDDLDYNEHMQLQNILGELGYADLEPDEFRW